MARVRAVSHEDRLTLVEHLDELRTRIIVCIVVFGVALALCFWQNDILLDIAGGPLPSDHDKLITFGVTEPFTTTITVSVYGALDPLDADPDLPALRLRAARPSATPRSGW